MGVYNCKVCLEEVVSSIPAGLSACLPALTLDSVKVHTYIHTYTHNVIPSSLVMDGWMERVDVMDTL